MKLYQVDWIIPISASMMMSYPATTTNKKAFTTREKAEEFYKKLYECAAILNIGGQMSANINEIEVE